jgi:hypothetical protein
MSEEQARALSRFNHLKWHKGAKAELIICGDNPISTSAKTMCKFCNKIIYYDTCCTDLHDEGAIFCCKKCVLERYAADINDDMRKILEMSIEG